MTEDNVIFSSEFNYQKIVQEGSTTDNIPTYAGSPTNITITHDLGYIPSFRIWYEPNNNRRYIAGDLSFTDTDGDGTDWSAGITAGLIYATSTTIVVGYANFSGSTVPVTTYYRIYQDS